MVGFMKHASSSEIGEIVLDQLSLHILSSNDHAHIAFDCLIESRKGKAAFISDLFSLDSEDLRVNEYKRIRPAFFRHIHNEEPLRQADLRSCKTDTTGIAHGLEHIRYGSFEAVCEIFVAYGLPNREKDRLGIMDYPHQCHKRLFYRKWQ